MMSTYNHFRMQNTNFSFGECKIEKFVHSELMIFYFV